MPGSSGWWLDPVEVPRSQSDPVRLLPLCEQLHRVPGVTAVLGLEYWGPAPAEAVIARRCPCLDRWHYRLRKDGAGRVPCWPRWRCTTGKARCSWCWSIPRARGFAALAVLPHALGGVVSTAEAAVERLRWLVMEMERRDPRADQPPGPHCRGGRAGGPAAERAAVEAMLTRLAQRGR